MKYLIVILALLSPFVVSYAQAIDSVSIMAIDNQGNKDTVTFGYVKPFGQDLDLKKDIRHSAGVVHFVLQIHAVSYPVALKQLSQGGQGTLIGQLIPVCLYDKDLNLANSTSIRRIIFDGPIDTILILNNESSNGLISFHPQFILGNLKTVNQKQ